MFLIYVFLWPGDLIKRAASKFAVFLSSIFNSDKAKTPDHGPLPFNLRSAFISAKSSGTHVKTSLKNNQVETQELQPHTPTQPAVHLKMIISVFLSSQK